MKLKTNLFNSTDFSVYTLFIVLLLISCKEKKPEIFEISVLAHNIYNEHTNKWQREEYFIIANYPKNKIEFENLIGNFNKATLTQEKIQSYSGFYRREFYKKTSRTMRVYNKPNLNEAYDYLDYYCYDDRIFIIDWVDYNDKLGIIVNYTNYIHGDDNDIYNAEGDELYFPWKR